MTVDRGQKPECGSRNKNQTFNLIQFRIPNSEFKNLCHLSLTSALSILLYKKIFMISEE